MPVELGCSAVQCVHNKNHYCAATSIQVRGGGSRHENHTFCNTFANASGPDVMTSLEQMMGAEHTLSSNGDTETASELFPQEGGSPHVHCTSSECRHNRRLACKAHGVHISAHASGDTVCRSFEL